jgi:oligopeptidase A
MVGQVENPFLDVSHPIAFDRMQAAHVRPAVAALLEDAKQRLAALEQDPAAPSYDNTLRAIEDVTDRLGRAMNVISHLESVATTPELREAYNEVQPAVSAFYSSIPLSSALFARLRALASTSEAKSLDPTRARFLKRTLESFEREGAALGDREKARLQAINVELSELTTRFSQNVLDATNAFQLVVEDESRLRGLPERAVDAAAHAARAKGLAGFRFTLHEPSLTPLLTYLDDAPTREQVYRAYYARAAAEPFDNRQIVERVLALRAEKAKLLGFRDFVDLIVADRMAQKGDRALDFLVDLKERSAVVFADETRALLDEKSRLLGDDAPRIAPWDVAYYAEKQRSRLYAFDEEALRPYFPLDSVMSGLFELLSRLYGVHVEQTRELPVWHESVRAYRMRDEDGSPLGVFYADLFPREEKRGGAWMNAFITGEPISGTWTEHVGLVCANVTPPIGDTPSLLSHREVETLFHEVGHLMHHMLTRVTVKSLAGTSVAWDFVELPSQIMENFCWERASLDLFARHHETGATIPDELLAKMLRARTYRGASAMMRQLGFGIVDLVLHMKHDPARDGSAVEHARKLLDELSPVKLPPDHAMVASFGHLFSHPVGYAGGYYSYKWAEVLDADAFSRFRTQGVFSRAVGDEFRRKILAQGDSRDPMELFVDFMGRAPDLRPLLVRCGIERAAAAE